MRMFSSARMPVIAVLDISGTIDETMALSIMLVLRNTDWRKRRIRALILRICSNGGSLGAAQAICEGVETLRCETGLVCATLVTDTALSAAFYVALSSDFSVASAAATVGNVGAIMGRINCWPLADKLGIGFLASKTGIGKGVLHPLAQPTPEGEAIMSDVVTDIGQQFIDWIQVRRTVEPETLRLLADGRLLSGQHARQLGLIDACGSLFTVITLLSERIGTSTTALVWLNAQPRSLWARLFGALKAAF